MTFDPREIPNNFRMQTLIEQGLKDAETLLTTKSEDALTVEELINLALIYMESGDREHTKKYASLARRDTSSKETQAAIFYILATFKREDNHCDEAIADFKTALELTESDWLKSNLLRNIGLAYLKLQQFEQAADFFQRGYDLSSSNPALRGALPALSNYIALSLARAALASGKPPTEGIAKFEETSALYETIFTEKGIHDETIRRQSHDFISHCVHQGMILCETHEKQPSVTHQDNLRRAQIMLLQALKSRQENKADGQRLGDVHVWLGRTYIGLGNKDAAQDCYQEALRCYRTIFSEDAKQITDLNTRMADLTATSVSRSSLLASHGTFKPSTDGKDAEEATETLTATAASATSHC